MIVDSSQLVRGVEMDVDERWKALRTTAGEHILVYRDPDGMWRLHPRFFETEAAAGQAVRDAIATGEPPGGGIPLEGDALRRAIFRATSEPES